MRPPHISAHNQSCRVDLQSVRLTCWTRNFFTRYGGSDYATGEASFEAKAWNESRTGAGGRRADFFTSGGSIRRGRADAGRAADTEHCTGSRNHPR
jgi:hypothetical protein